MSTFNPDAPTTPAHLMTTEEMLAWNAAFLAVIRPSFRTVTDAQIDQAIILRDQGHSPEATADALFQAMSLV